MIQRQFQKIDLGSCNISSLPSIQRVQQSKKLEEPKRLSFSQKKEMEKFEIIKNNENERSKLTNRNSPLKGWEEDLHSKKQK